MQQGISLRSTLVRDLRSSQERLQCSCCVGGESRGPSRLDVCLAFDTLQELEDGQSVHDWLRSFATALQPAAGAPEASVSKRRSQRKALPAEQEVPEGAGAEAESPPYNDASVQARFIRGAAELQLLGAVRPLPKRAKAGLIGSVRTRLPGPEDRSNSVPETE